MPTTTVELSDSEIALAVEALGIAAAVNDSGGRQEAAQAMKALRERLQNQHAADTAQTGNDAPADPIRRSSRPGDVVNRIGDVSPGANVVQAYDVFGGIQM
ncbi:hypothetical protein [Amycolatopsis rubida]|uniref:Uncharacterized protein n=1 Tax=Amycolatopsis rubida TaxID=112413 RepID=A0A1I5XJC2_9PSEU|nr:hypothetical protein [Amycolatopsis rubida]SFQ31777.1 hypothetical protein SAMN05421854_110259 [Amycolatopsis rubida]